MPAGRPIGKRHQEDVRLKIKYSHLINRLTDHALGKLEKPMEPSQVTAALGLIRKGVPDLSVQQVQGQDGGPVKLEQSLTIYGVPSKG
jgi:hypothetical protein